MTRKLVLGIGVLGLLAGCSANAEESASSESVAAVSETPNAAALDCNVSGSFGAEAMKAVGDGTYVRAGTAPSNGLKSFTLGPIQEIPGWAGKNVEYTRDMAAPCLDFKAVGDGSGFPKGSALPMTETGCAGQTGKATVMMDNPAIGAFIMFEDASGLPAGKDVYFVTASRIDPNGKVSALCLANATTRDQLLVTRQ